jgi:alpha-L-fucosidase
MFTYMNKILLISLLHFIGCRFAFSQSTIHPVSTEYQYPKEKEVAQNLENWRDQKFGIIIHWGLYAVPGIIESWSLCDEDWINRDSMSNYAEYKKWYWGQNKSFNPVKFNPEAWATAAKTAGMKYLVFTTKHHDGFNMFDTKFSDFKISNGPFKENPKADVAKFVFDAFRKQNFLIGAYYSKPDWHSQYFWWDRHSTPNRNVNYDIRKHPWRWNKFVEYTHNQLNELTTDYGKVDILWLDGGWVRPRNTVTDEVLAWGAPIPDFDQEINMPQVAKMVRKNQEGILIVDRTLGGAWGFVPNDKFKPAATVIHTLIEIVAKGGNLLLGVGPTAEGEFLPEQISRLNEIGVWMNKFGEAIYNTRSLEVFQSGDVYFTKSKDNYAFAIQKITSDKLLKETITWKGNSPKKGSKVNIVGESETLKWETKGDLTTVWISKKAIDKYKNEPALAIKYEF